jgi:fumarylacetoacetase
VIERVNETHDPSLRSWVASANASEHDFPIQNLPFGVGAVRGAPRVLAAIGDDALDVNGMAASGLIAGCPPAVVDACTHDSLNALMSCRTDDLLALRRSLQRALRADAEPSLKDAVAVHLHPRDEVAMAMPAVIGDYSDFFASIDHARNVGKLFRSSKSLSPNYTHVPIAYHGRSSSIVPDGTPIHRPLGQRSGGEGKPPLFGPSTRLDYEVEVGFFIGRGNARGTTIPVTEAGGCLFGVCLLNDWSARDIQAWESQPLGPFLAKNFATTISPWVVTREALIPFRVAARGRRSDEPEPLAYLDDEGDRQAGALALTVDAFLLTARMRAAGMAPVHVSRSSASSLYWTPAQMIAHHTSNGCNLRPGDLLGSGTISGVSDDSRACLLELTSGGRDPLLLTNGEQRAFLEDGDDVILRGSCRAAGYVRIGFGECRGRIEGSL